MQAVVQLPIALLSALVTAPGGVATVLRIVRLLRRNFALVLLLAIISALLWPVVDIGASDEAPDIARNPNGSDDHMRTASRH